MRTRHALLCAAMAALFVAACGDNGSGPTVDAGPPDAPPDAACVPVDDSNECTTDECVGGQPVHTPRDGASCTGGGTCNAQGTCVPAPTCTDGMMNGDETGVDCGGSCAPGATCPSGGGCVDGDDCMSGVCGATMTCSDPRCGDGVTQAGEMCDDGNDTNGDGCDDGDGDVCRPTGCGNGVVTGTEVCDDGNDVNGDGCDNNCTATACGNGVVSGTETCDDGNTTAADGCSDTCATEAGYTCSAAVPNVCSPICGDGVLVGAETCDQGGGNVADGDGCSSVCATENGWTCTGTPSTCSTTCGDSITAGAETCDDGNLLSLDGCSATCTTDTAGTAELEPNEDGTPSTGGSGIAGNDFDGAGGMAVANATAQGVILASGGSTLRIGTLTPAGDEDVYAITNDTTAFVNLRLDVWNRTAGFGLGVPCGTSIDTGLHVRDAAGTSLQSNDDRAAAADRCSGLSWAVAPGATVYAHVVEFGDNAVVDGYALQVGITPVVCGDGVLTPVAEECDDGNTMAGDGCSATCTAEFVDEVEPNEDGTPVTGGSGIAGNDFDNAGGVAVANATAQGVYDVAAPGRRTWRASLRVGAAPGTAGDEDVFAVTNSGTATIEVFAETRDLVTGLGAACPTTVDTGLNVRRADGTLVTSNDDTSGLGACSRVSFVLAPGEFRYLHVVEFGDNAVIPSYALVVTRRPVICGDGVVTAGAETCDDGNTAASDGCSATCAIETGFYCSGAPSLCRPVPTTIPLACVDMTTGTSLTLSDDDEAVSARAALPFSFPLYGATMTHYSVSTNGFAGFFTSDTGTISSTATNPSTVPSTTTPNGYLAPFWDDLDLSTVRVLTSGTAPSRTFTIEWNAAIFNVTGTNLVFQLQIGEAGGVQYHYCSGVPGATGAARISGSSATVAAENAAGTIGRAIGINTSGTVTPGTTAFSWTL